MGFTCQVHGRDLYFPYMREVEALPARLRRLRTERELSQEGLAYEMYRLGSKGATAGAIGQFERGVTRPRPDTIETLARALAVDPTEFVEYQLARARGHCAIARGLIPQFAGKG